MMATSDVFQASKSWIGELSGESSSNRASDDAGEVA